MDDITSEAMENYIATDIMIYHFDTEAQGSVIRRNCYVEENTIGRVNSNPILDTRNYEVEFEDGSMSIYSANVIK